MIEFLQYFVVIYILEMFTIWLAFGWWKCRGNIE